MRTIDELPDLATWKEIQEAVGDEPLYFIENGPSWRLRKTLTPRAVLLPVSDNEINLANAYRQYSTKNKSYGNIKHTDVLLRLTPDSIEIVHNKKMSWRYTSRMELILTSYYLTVGWIPCGPNRGQECIWIPHPEIDPDPDYRRPRTEDFLLRGLHSVPLQPGLSFDYRGKCITDKPPTLAQCKKIAASFMKRSHAASGQHKAASMLGFYTGFETNGYPIPKDKSEENLRRLNEQAIALGYRNIAHAWENGVPVVGEIDDQWMEHHEQGLTRLLADSIKESRRKK